MQNAVPVIRFVNPKEPIRVALGKLGYPNMMQTLELDLVHWCVEAVDLIKKQKGLKKYTETRYSSDSKIALCRDDLAIDCVTINGSELNYKETSGCGSNVTSRCRKCCGNSGKTMSIDGCYIHLSPSVADGTEVEVTSLKRPVDVDGYPLIPEVTVVAVAEYVKWMLCVRERDNRAGDSERRWYALCRIARGELKSTAWTQSELEKFGYFWW